ncbi:LuxR C-terminal-related transcriptional regulator [Aquipseudomonas ullengensis]|uniref:HTH luxR-type domain-containing protein n=1 Tax=Aquipseudomonas ullengensis TaxID=2759166 RepID=A0A7W4QC31_9GAMM|nr:LuxR C-terminal-related transcriptional regulator [Pseudomonas ullengensis]MBB2494521.1 hypothetical protein [Pseudomonas ullengensis]
MSKVLSRDVRLRLLCAAAGSGKTTLMADCARSHTGGKVAWIPLHGTALSNEAFLQHLVDALGLAAPEGINEALATRALLSISEPVWVMLDDYPHQPTPELDALLGRLLNLHTPVVQWWITSRRRIAINMAKLLIADELLELNGVDLALTHAELPALLGEGTDLKAFEGTFRDTQGWFAAASIWLAAQQSQRSHLSSNYQLESLLRDYVEIEVLGTLQGQLRQQLAVLAVASAFDEALCSHLLNLTDSYAWFRDLESQGALLYPIAEHPGWFRLMPTAASVLARELSTEDTQRIHLQACDWLAQQEQYRFAIDHALAAGKHERATKLLEQLADRRLLHGFQSTQVFEWFNDLPNSLTHSSSDLVLLNAFAFGVTFQVEKAAACLESLNKFLPAATAEQHLRTLGRGQALLGLLAHASGDREHAQRHCKEAIAVLPVKDWAVQLLCRTTLINHALFAGQLAAVDDLLASARQFLKLFDSELPAVVMDNYQAEVMMVRGQLVQAETMLERNLLLITNTIFSERGWVGRLHLKLGQVQMRLGKIALAEEHFWTAFRIMRNALEPAAYQALLALADLALLDDEVGKANSLVEKAARLLAERKMTPSSYLANLELAQAKVLIRRQEPARALLLLENIRQRHACGQSTQPMSTLELLLECEGLIAEVGAADHSQARRELQEVIAKATPLGYLTCAADLTFKLALLSYNAGEKDEARTWLLQALETAKPLNHRLPMEYLERTHPDLCSLVERERQHDLLSERETEVLRLVEACLSNVEIGQRLFISMFTVKSHIQRICGKLGVRRRAQAVAKAKSMGIL